MSNIGEPGIDSEGLLGQKLLGIDLGYEFRKHEQKGCLSGRLSGNKHNKNDNRAEVRGNFLSLCSSFNPQEMRSMPMVLYCT